MATGGVLLIVLALFVLAPARAADVADGEPEVAAEAAASEARLARPIVVAGGDRSIRRSARVGAVSDALDAEAVIWIDEAEAASLASRAGRSTLRNRTWVAVIEPDGRLRGPFLVKD